MNVWSPCVAGFLGDRVPHLSRSGTAIPGWVLCWQKQILGVSRLHIRIWWIGEHWETFNRWLGDGGCLIVTMWLATSNRAGEKGDWMWERIRGYWRSRCSWIRNEMIFWMRRNKMNPTTIMNLTCMIGLLFLWISKKKVISVVILGLNASQIKSETIITNPRTN